MDVLVTLHPHILAVLDGDSIGHYFLVAFFICFTSYTEDVLGPRTGRKREIFLDRHGKALDLVHHIDILDTIFLQIVVEVLQSSESSIGPCFNADAPTCGLESRGSHLEHSRGIWLVEKHD